MIIIVDVDNVLNDLTEKAIELYNQRSGKSITMDDFTDYNFYMCLEKDDANAIKALFIERALWDSLKPIAGSQKSIQKLIEKGHRVIFATATDPQNVPWKIQWMAEWFPFVHPDNVIRIMDKSLLKGDVIIDDDITQLTKSFAERICFDYPWNHQSDLKDEAYGIKRCVNWDEIISAINLIEKDVKKYE